eukprot:636269-Pyramimonas_sp.AAC.1
MPQWNPRGRPRGRWGTGEPKPRQSLDRPRTFASKDARARVTQDCEHCWPQLQDPQQNGEAPEDPLHQIRKCGQPNKSQRLSSSSQ